MVALVIVPAATRPVFRPVHSKCTTMEPVRPVGELGSWTYTAQHPGNTPSYRAHRKPRQTRERDPKDAARRGGTAWLPAGSASLKDVTSQGRNGDAEQHRTKRANQRIRNAADRVHQERALWPEPAVREHRYRDER